MFERIWRRYFEPRIQGLITRRILVFHDALVRRGQISKPTDPTHCMSETISRLDRTPHLDVPDRQRS